MVSKEYKEKIDYSPTLYSNYSTTNRLSNTSFNQYVKPIQFNNISKARDFRRNYNTDNAPIFNMDRYQYQYISDNYPNDDRIFKRPHKNIY